MSSPPLSLLRWFCCGCYTPTPTRLLYDDSANPGETVLKQRLEQTEGDVRHWREQAAESRRQLVMAQQELTKLREAHTTRPSPVQSTPPLHAQVAPSSPVHSTPMPTAHGSMPAPHVPNEAESFAAAFTSAAVEQSIHKFLAESRPACASEKAWQPPPVNDGSSSGGGGVNAMPAVPGSGPVRSGGAAGNRSTAPTPDSLVGSRVRSMSNAGADAGSLGSQRFFDPLAASRGSTPNSGESSRLVRADSVSRQSLDGAGWALAERFDSIKGRRKSVSGDELSPGLSDRDLQKLRRAQETVISETARAAAAEERAVQLESSLAAAQVEASRLREQLRALGVANV